MLKTFRWLAASAVILVSAASAAHAQDGGVWGKIEASGKMNCGVVTDTIPASWKPAGSDKYFGYVPGFCRAMVPDLSKAMGKEIELVYVPTSWATVILDVQSGRIDLAGGLSITPERAKAIDMPGPAYVLLDTLLVRKDFPLYKTWEEYNKPEIRVASTTGTSSERTANEKLPATEKLSFKDRPSMILSLQSARADISVSAFVAALNTMKEAGDQFGGWIVPEPAVRQPSAFGVRRDGDGRFNAWVQKWAETTRAEGRVKDIIKESFKEAGLDTSNMSGVGD